jgi:hypothetical protein
MQLFDSNEYDLKGRLNKFFHSERNDDAFNDYEFDEIDNVLDDFDFSNFDDKDFKQSFAKVKSQIKKVIVPGNRKVIVEGQKQPGRVPFIKDETLSPSKNSSLKLDPSFKQQKQQQQVDGIGVQEGEQVLIKGRNKKTISKIQIPRDRKVIVEGANKMMLSEDKRDTLIKQLGYYKG